MSEIGGLSPIGISPILTSIRVLIPFINNMMKAGQGRTVVVYYHNATADEATEVFRTIDYSRAPTLSVNVDNPTFVPPDDYVLGSALFNICILKNIHNGPHQERMLHLVDRNMINLQFIIVLEKASNEDVVTFFKMLWTKHKMIKVAAFFLDGQTVDVRTLFPFENRFGAKIDEFDVSKPSLQPSTMDKCFHGKVFDLHGTKVNVYMSENFPKTFQAPARYRRSQTNFYFAGRDGLAVQNGHLAFNVSWQYKTLPSNLVSKISLFDFGNDSRHTDAGITIESHQNVADNLEYVNLREGEPIANAFNNCEIIFESKYVTPSDRSKPFNSLYAHESDSFVILVQNQFYSDLGMNWPIFLTVPISFIICTIVRKTIRVVTNNPDRDFISIVMIDLGVFLSTNASPSMANRAERILHISIVLFSMMLSILASAIFFGFFLAKDQSSGIDSLNELAATKLPICITEELNETIENWSQNLDERILHRIWIVSDKDQLQMIMARNFSTAYAISKMKAEMLLNSPELKENGISVYHMVKEIFVPALMSFQVATDSPLELRLTIFMQTLIESGYLEQFKANSLNLIRQVTKADILYASALESSFAASFTSFSIEQIMPYFIVCNVGLLLSIVVFFGEIVFYKYSNNRKKGKDIITNQLVTNEDKRSDGSIKLN